MNADIARLSRLRRLERIRAIARQAAAGEAAAAEMTLARLVRLSERTRNLADGYGCGRELDDGASLRRHAQFKDQINTLTQRTADDVAAAQAVADAKQAELAMAERRRAAVEDRADRQARSLAGPAYEAALGVRRGFGTKLD